MIEMIPSSDSIQKYNELKTEFTLQLSQHNPDAHSASVFSLHVMLSQHRSFSHSSLEPQSHSSSSSMILLPQFLRSISN